MANTRSAIKRVRTNEVRRQRNVARRSAMRTAVKKCLEAVATSDKQVSQVSFQEAARKLDKAARRGIIHPNKAARKKSQLARKINALSV